MRINVSGINLLATTIFIASVLILFHPITNTFQASMDRSQGALTENEYADKLFHEKLADYKEINAQIPLNFKITLVFSLVGLVALFSRKHELEIPIANLSLPKKLALAVLIVGILYFWLSFGFTLNRAIYARHSLEVIQQAVEAKNNLANVHPMISLDSLLQDNGFLDAWFAAYRNHLRNYGFPPSAKYFLELFLCGWGIIYGISHGIMLVMTKHIFNKEPLSSDPLFGGNGVKNGCLLFLVLIICFSHILFRLYGEQDALSFQISILASAIITLWVLDHMVRVRMRSDSDEMRLKHKTPSAPREHYAAK